jgi:dTDP-4-amino-4,6-dideoxygalactose transaminase
LGEEEVGAVEREFSAAVDVAHGVGVATGTDAIELMLRGLDLGQGVAVVVPAMTATASAVGVLRAGAEVVLADVDAETLTLSPESLRAVLKSPVGDRVRSVVVMHLHGHCSDWEGLRAVAEPHGVMLLEDAAQAHGAKVRNQTAGSLGRAAAFSFYPTKNLGALGDSGMVVTDDASLAERVRRLSEYGWQRRQVASEFGINSRMDELQAAVLRVKLKNLTWQNDQRALQAEVDAAHLKGCTLSALKRRCRPAWHFYAVLTAKRDALADYLTAEGVPTGIHYPIPLHLQPGLAVTRPVPLPVAERAARELLLLPLHGYLSEEAVLHAAELVNAFLKAEGHA